MANGRGHTLKTWTITRAVKQDRLIVCVPAEVGIHRTFTKNGDDILAERPIRVKGFCNVPNRVMTEHENPFSRNTRALQRTPEPFGLCSFRIPGRGVQKDQVTAGNLDGVVRLVNRVPGRFGQQGEHATLKLLTIIMIPAREQNGNTGSP